MHLPASFTTKSSEETQCLAKKIAKECDQMSPSVICLQGNLGTGKTTFVKGFCDYFNIDDRQVKSPTYTYYRVYKNDQHTIYHFDYYRLALIDDRTAEEFLEIAEQENSFILIEWPRNIDQLIPSSALMISLSYGEKDNWRVIRITKKHE
jgi:tRNA threonylcarbamoyladenosine biosynthesis protein TsaE